EDNRLRLRRGSLARQPQRVADEVRDVLHLRHLVVVGEDDGAALARQCLHLLVHESDLRCRHRTSMETSSERAPCVSAPIEMKSTPVSAMERTVSSVTPPDASVFARPVTSATAARSSAGVMLSSSIVSAPAASAS